MIGKTLSQYRIDEQIGAGGMGEVYRAHDTQLGRDVALKVLPDTFADDPDRLARFEREARVLASLNHPHIAAIHGLEEADGIRFLVLEFVPGETLADQLARGPLPLEEALPLARQIAEALEAAHEQGIIHRDLKPANVKITPEGQAKVLDFGLAKAFEGESAEADPARSPTLTQMATQQGIILGTAAYMSPEQAKGKVVDRRADIWAFGCLLYEMLSGRRTFTGETVSETMAAVMMKEPPWEALPGELPNAMRRLLHRCLTKDPKQRLRDIGEARIAINEYLSQPELSVPVETAPTLEPLSAWRRVAPWTLLGLLAIVTLVLSLGLWQASRTDDRLPIRFLVQVSPEEQLFTQLGAAAVLSPDGRRLAYVAGTETGQERRLYLRSLDQFYSTPLSGTEGARNPFFSPDGEWLGFFTDGALKKVSIFGGAPLTLCPTQDSRGGTWGPDDTIIFAGDTNAGLSRIPAVGGTPEELTTPDEAGGSSHRFPAFLPDGQVVLFQTRTGNESFDEGNIEVLSLETGERKVLQRGGYYPRFIPTGHLLYTREGTLFAAPFNSKQLKIVGPPAPLIEGIVMHIGYGGAQYDVAQNGTLIYLSGGSAEPEHRVVLVNMDGTATSLIDDPKWYATPRFSPDGGHLLFTVNSLSSGDDIWRYDIARDVMTRLTFNEADDFAPLWSPDGQWMVFASDREGGQPSLFRIRADGTGELERLTESQNFQVPQSWSPDGNRIVFLESRPETNFDILVLPLEGERKPTVFLSTPFVDSYTDFSPDGRWLTYMSMESGRPEVYVRPFPGPGGKWQISDGGTDGAPRWSPDSQKIYYRIENKMMAVPVSTEGSSFRAGRPQVLFENNLVRFSPQIDYDLAPDGQRFVMFQRAEGDEEVPPHNHLNVVLNWFEEIRRLGPAK